MDQQQIISPRQFSWISTVIIFTSSQTFVPREALYISHHNAWFTYILPLVYVLFITYVFYELCKVFPKKNIFEISFLLFGKFVGGFINILMILYIWSSFMRNISTISVFMDSTILILTPVYVIGIICNLIVQHYGKMSIEVSARVNELTFILFITMAFSMPLMLIGDIQVQNVLPILSHGVNGFFKSNTLNLGWFGDLFILGAFLHTLSVPRQVHASLRYGAINATFLLTLIMMLTITILGPNIGSKAMYPIYLLAEQIHFTDFLERLEIIMVTAYTFSYMLSMIFIFIAGLIGISSFTKRRDYRIYSSSAGWLMYMITVLSFSNITDLYNFVSYSSVIIAITIQVPILILFWIFSKRKKYRKQISVKVKKEHKYGRSFRWMTNGFILLSLVFIFFGIWLGDKIAICGTIAGLGFLLSLSSALITSLLEMIKCNKLRRNNP
ncbi:GerAB/ArcD/ProY family transporter [Chengkuizengella axinellae]|uniref:Endospore germination permease n=1 Tax=Chengkuizengella axinellae TaxID=3064388 RepID=A0ABT9J4Y3_9BACL|nr:endospore germination permease [Chengkuizengella sp. 2205SS18-9]MDP5276666.1 endospore germination permease [Chengkuizengella sp. 2205SS18-9]